MNAIDQKYNNKLPVGPGVIEMYCLMNLNFSLTYLEALYHGSNWEFFRYAADGAPSRVARCLSTLSNKSDGEFNKLVLHNRQIGKILYLAHCMVVRLGRRNVRAFHLHLQYLLSHNCQRHRLRLHPQMKKT